MMAHGSLLPVLLTLIGFIVVCGASSNPIQKDCNSLRDCHGTVYDIHEAVCCERVLHPGVGLACCGKQSYNPAEATCCEEHGRDSTAKVTPGLSQRIASCCGLTAYNPLNELCCNTSVVAKPSGNADCCRGVAIDKDTKLCCGRTEEEKRILKKSSDHHRCCGQDQYDTVTQCCCYDGSSLKIERKNSSQCCVKESGVHLQNRGPHSKSTKPHTGHQMKSLESPLNCTSGQLDAVPTVPTVCHPHSHICCQFGWRASNNQSCGGTQVILTEGRVLCCDRIMHKDREGGNECQAADVPHYAAEGTVCCSRFHSSHGEHCCGTELYQPHREICCSGHRYPNMKNVHCCGVKAYNIKDRQKKCCAGRLHILSHQSAREAKCCGSMLQKPSDVCCKSESEEVLYAQKPNFRCCGHLYFNTSLLTCCEGRLRPVHKPPQHQSKLNNGFRLLSLSNLHEDELCGEVHTGIVDSVSLHSIVFSSVLKLHGRNATMYHLPSTYILKKPDGCNFPKLYPGRIYFFTQVMVSVDFNHDSLLESLYFIFSKCSSSYAFTD